ncbi:restriction endonuclease subunit S [Leuconostoc suionicum]|uniref:restriction endonuclease subunit S n=1 Tax=Leuconostoc suionicum TaxID=1511761 RepID=UPI0024AD1926|nr:restriction endonuclease subunit S [Leuconostoc suionicum]MDI6545592.1 restriction endonuclease subunit S [Leuconostoc suionicum]
MSKMTPQIRFQGFTDDWEEHKLNENVENIGTGRSSFKAGLDYSEQTPYEVLGSTSVISYSDSFDHSGNFVLTARVGANAGNLYKHSGNVKISDNTVYIQSKNLEFIFYLLTKYDLKKLAFGTGQPLIKASELKNLKLFFPKTFEEQQKIGSFFKQLDDTIALHQRMLDLLKEQKKGFLQKMFPKNGAKVPELRFSGFADDWEERKLGEVGNTFTGLTGKTKEDFGHGSAKFVTYVNVFQNPIATLDQLDAIEIDEKQNQVQKGDIFFTTSSETPEEVGMSSVWTHDTENVYLNSFTFGYRPRVSFDLNYMASMLRSPSIRKKITFLAQGISRYNISKTKMLEIEIPTPTLSEQEKIGSFFKQLDNTIALHQRKLDLLKEQKKGFLQKMFVS